MYSTLTVAELTAKIKELLENSESLQKIKVKGEISNANIYPSGHLYFTLKDSNSQISCVMFSARLRLTPFLKDIKDGIKVIAAGRVTLYEKKGQYQLIVDSLELDGIGELYKAFQKLKEKLQKEGLFDEELKRPIPEYPSTVGIVTSLAGAAIHDMISIIRRRNKSINIILSPAQVQGVDAPPSIIRALRLLWQKSDLDAIIIGRGGGSLEDLWAFNDEELARVIRQSPVPIISAVGHETDFTIADLVADKRAPTPSGAAELIAPDKSNLERHITASRQYMVKLVERKMNLEQSHLKLIMERRPFKFPMDKITGQLQRVDELIRSLRQGLLVHISRNKERFSTTYGKLETLSPLGVLKRGYCICETLPERRIIKSANEPHKGQSLALRFADGEIQCQVPKNNKQVKNKTDNNANQLLLGIDA